MKKVHKMIYIPYTGWYHLCTNSDKYKLCTVRDWRDVTCGHCLKKKGKESPYDIH